MVNNTLKHISDESKYVKFDPTGTSFNSGVTDVQTALGLLSGDGVNGVPPASETMPGKIRIATQEEVDNGILGDIAVTPKTLEVRLQRPQATTEVFGVTRYATNAEAISGLADDRSIVASSLKAVLDNTFAVRVSTETSNGVLKLSTTPAAVAGVDDTTAMTPLKTKQAIAAATSIIPVYGPATESALGVVRLTTLGQLRDPTIREGFAPSPFALNQWQATEANMGATKIASQIQMETGTDRNTTVTPFTFATTRATTTRTGTVRLAERVGDGTTALSGSANVLASDRPVVTVGGVYENAILPQNKYMTRGDLTSYISVGFMTLAAFNSDQGNMLICNGRLLNISEYPELFAKIGTIYGGDGITTFAIPDMRGVVARGHDAGRGLDPGRTFGSYQDDAMQPIIATWGMDDQSVDFYHPTGALYTFGRYSYDAKSNGQWGGYMVRFDSSRVSRTAPETRVKSVAINYVICVR